MTVGVLSDLHGVQIRVETALALLGEADAYVFLGDGTDAVAAYTQKPVYRVRGNCDWDAYDVPDELLLNLDGHSVFCCHGHIYDVKSSLSRLASAARARGARCALYGHTHIADVSLVDDVLCVNPGALSSPRSASCALLHINDKEIVPILRNLT